jgi:hypothetical protein
MSEVLRLATRRLKACGTCCGREMRSRHFLLWKITHINTVAWAVGNMEV